MSGLDKILEHINLDATNTAKELLEGAKAEALKIKETLEAEAKHTEQTINEQSKTAVETAKKRIESAADQKEKRMILEAKQAEIEKVLSASVEKMEGLDDKSYFATITKMISKYAHEGKEGTIAFGKKDLDRLPSDIVDQLKNTGLTVADEAANIKSGFVLSYGDIEENCSFEALIDASKEILQDKIGQVLFG